MGRIKHGLTPKGGKLPPEYKSWVMMKYRCNTPTCDAYQHYGGRGITVCSRWQFGEDELSGFECFVIDMGQRPSPKHTVERRDNSGNYEPRNCYWGTKKQQSRNQRSTKLDQEKVQAIRNDPRSLSKIAKDYGVCIMTISNVKRGLRWAE